MLIDPLEMAPVMKPACVTSVCGEAVSCVVSACEMQQVRISDAGMASRGQERVRWAVA